MIEKHDIIRILEFAEASKDGFSINKALGLREVGDLHLKELGNCLFSTFVLFRKYPNYMFNDYFSLVNEQEILGRYKSTADNFTHYGDDIADFFKRAKFVLSTEGYFKLNQYRQLEEATMSSNKAQKTANWALILAIIVGIAQITVGILSLINC